MQNNYLLGINEEELKRLEFQHFVWKDVTDSFIRRAGIKSGMKILDAGSGPGFVSFDLRKIAGSSGEVTALEPSEIYLDYYRKISNQNNWKNMKSIHGSVETAEIPLNHFDAVFSRWVISFVNDAELFLKKLLLSLKPGGIIAIMDYAYEGLAVYPRGGAFDNMCETVKSYWRYGGGNPYAGALLPSFFRKMNVKITDYTPVVLVGEPDSLVFRWADMFFSRHIPKMIEIGITDRKTGDEMLADWINHRENPDSVFFSPVLVTASGILQHSE